MTQKKNPHVTDEQIVDAYKSLHSSIKVARQLGVTERRVTLTLRRLGIPRDGLEFYRQSAQAYPADVQLEMVRLHQGGMSLAELAAKYGGSDSSVRMAIIRNGAEVIPGATSRRKIAGEVVDRICAEYLSGKSQDDVADQVGVSQAVVSRVLRERGVQMRKGPAKGKRHSRWMGGRMKTYEGYWRVHVEAGDRFAEMRDRTGYVLEHRLVMAKTIGRALTRNETVHHINGNKADNRPENLQLRHGRHGKHVVLCCQDCGSQNMGPAPIATAVTED